MGLLDIAIGLLLAWGLWRGLANGLILELAAIAALIAGIYGTVHFSGITADYLSQKLDWAEGNLRVAAFIITFLGIVFLVHWAGKLLTKVVNLVFLGMLNKIAGGLFGAMKIAVILGALILYFERFDAQLGILDEETKAESVLYGPVKELGSVIFSAVFPDKELV